LQRFLEMLDCGRVLAALGLHEALLVGRASCNPEKAKKKEGEYRNDFSSHTVLPF